MPFSFIFSILVLFSPGEAKDLTCLERLTTQTSSALVGNIKLGPNATKEEVLEHYKGFNSSDVYARGSVTHAVLAQTSWYTDLGFDELIALMNGLPDLSDISKDPASRAVLLQTILLSEKSAEEVLAYYRNFPEIDFLRRDLLPTLILIQTAFLTEIDSTTVIEYFKTFPKTAYFRKEIGFGIIIQTAFIAELENRVDINTHYRKIFPALFATANKGFVAIFKQTQLFATRAFD